MKSIISTSILMLLAICTLASLPPQQAASLYQHMTEINVQWLNQIPQPTDTWLETVSFKSDQERIQTHLFYVHQILLERSQVSNPNHRQRLQLLQVLKRYYETGLFPQNRYHQKRTPYFIDHLGTPCAVGHLIIESENASIAHAIREKSNYAYIRQLDQEVLANWGNAHGFTIPEMAWIQPGYAPQHVWTSPDSGLNGQVMAMAVDQLHNQLILAGEFDQAGAIQANQIVAYDGQSYLSLGEGLSGQINDVLVSNGYIYAGGLFDGPEGYNMARWDGSSWEYRKIGHEGVVHCLLDKNGVIYAGGELIIHGIAGPIYYNVFLGQWNQWEIVSLDEMNGPVYSLAVYEEDVIAGGDFTQIGMDSIMHIARLDLLGLSWNPIGEGLDNTVFALEVQDDTLFAGGHFHDLQTNAPTFGLSRYHNESWTQMIPTGDFIHYIDSTYTHTIYDIKHTGSGLFVSGTFGLQNNIFLFHNGPSVAVYIHNGEYLQGIASPSHFPEQAAVYELDIIHNHLYVGGTFSFNAAAFGQSTYVNHFMATPYFTTNIDRNLSLRPDVKWYPNPMHSECILEYDGTPGQGNLQLQLFSINGQKMPIRYETLDKGLRLYRDHLAAGIYLFKLSAQSEVIGYGKLVIE